MLLSLVLISCSESVRKNGGDAGVDPAGTTGGGGTTITDFLSISYSSDDDYNYSFTASYTGNANIEKYEWLVGGVPQNIHSNNFEHTFVYSDSYTIKLNIYNSSDDLIETDSGFMGTYDIPDLILYRKPLKNCYISGDTLHFGVFWGKFNCILNPNKNEITGQNENWNPSVVIHLKRKIKQDVFKIENCSDFDV